MEVEEIVIRDQTIRLGQLLKLASVVATGGEAKARIQKGEVLVNGAIETRRGTQLRVGDLVEVDGQCLLIK